MRPSRRLALLAAPLALTLAVAPVAALGQGGPPGKADPRAVVAGTYAADPEHTLVQFTVNHLGFSPYFGLFGGATGTLTLDPKRLGDAKVSVSIPLSRLTTTSAGLVKHMQSPDFFDMATYPDVTFTSTKVTPTGASTATIDGLVTIKGKASPVSLKARFVGAGVNTMTKGQTVGFEATGEVSRTALGVPFIVPAVSDKVELRIAASFNKQG